MAQQACHDAMAANHAAASLLEWHLFMLVQRRMRLCSHATRLRVTAACVHGPLRLLEQRADELRALVLSLESLCWDPNTLGARQIDHEIELLEVLPGYF